MVLRQLLGSRRGASVVEYALLAALIALAGLLAMCTLGGEVGTTLNKVEANMASATGMQFSTP